MQFSNYNQVQEYILSIPKFSKKTTKQNLINIYNKLNINDMKIIHVAGTNGKGSVCAFLTSILVTAGKKTGTFISPHLVSMTERIRINEIPVEQRLFMDSFNKVYKAVEENIDEGGVHPSFFEILFLMAMVIFSMENVDYVILETGMGGRMDATNIFDKPLISVITSISMDHMEILGDTIEKIAHEKAGIIKRNVPVIFYGEDERVRHIIEKESENNHSDTVCVKKSDILSIKKSENNIAFSYKSGYDVNSTVIVPFIAEYQTINALLAVRTIECLNLVYGENISEKDIYTGIKNTYWEARMEQICQGVFLDGAHNPEGIEAFVSTVKDYNTKGKKIILFSAVKEKQYNAMIKDIVQNTGAEEFIITHIDNKRGIPVDIIKEEMTKYISCEHITEANTVVEAFEIAMRKKQECDTLFIVGSLYLAGEIKKCLSEIKEG